MPNGFARSAQALPMPPMPKIPKVLPLGSWPREKPLPLHSPLRTAVNGIVTRFRAPSMRKMAAVYSQCRKRLWVEDVFTVCGSIIYSNRSAADPYFSLCAGRHIDIVISSSVMRNISQVLRQRLYHFTIERSGNARRLVRSVDSNNIIILARLALLYEVLSCAGGIFLLLVRIDVV